tara:strand:- start:3472 stop:4176 length:705 start_codon:yes stop_codon:yes gene_type:complete
MKDICAIFADNLIAVMQSMAVLLLEMAYGNKDMRDSDPSMTTSIRKLIRWLRAMQQNDPVAARAYKVTWKILKACAPTLQAQANDLLAMEEEDAPLTTSYQNPSAAYDNPGTAHWSQTEPFDSAMEDTGTFDPQMFPQSSYDAMAGYPYDSNAFYPVDQNPIPMVFGNPFFTSFDQGAPVVDIQDLWANQVTSSTYGTNLSELNIAQDQHGIPQDSEMDFSPRQQHFPRQPPHQ